MNYVNKKVPIVFSIITGIFIGCGGSSNPSKQNDDPPKVKEIVAQALLGPISEGDFSIKKLDTNIEITRGVTTAGEKPNIEDAGLIVIDQSIKDTLDAGFYLIEVTGGKDIDNNDNGVWDDTPTPNLGTLHGIMSDTQLKAGKFKVNILTEIVYQDIKTQLAIHNLTQEEISQRIDEKAKELLKDVNGDGNIDASDIISWNPSSDKQKLKIDYDDKLKPIVHKVLNNQNVTSITKRIFTSPSKGKLLKTGQIESYYPKDDGDLMIGKTRSYSRDDANSIVIDHTTGLMWQDDENVTLPSSNSKTWSDANTTCEMLEAGGYSDWRVPMIEELVTLTDKGNFNNAIDATFMFCNEYNYWSITVSPNPNYDYYVKAVRFSDGKIFNANKTHNNYVRCVRDK